jgi:hypothetical protein
VLEFPLSRVVSPTVSSVTNTSAAPA